MTTRPPKRSRVNVPGHLRTECRFLMDTHTGERFLLALGRVEPLNVSDNPSIRDMDRLEILRRITSRKEPAKMRRAYLEELIRRDKEVAS